jgi:hypothetical protein
MDNSGRSFLFSLKNPRESEPRKFMAKNGKNANYCHSSSEPIFAGNHDMRAYAYCKISNSNWTNLEGDNVNDPSIDGKLASPGKNNFMVKEIEVVTIIAQIIEIFIGFIRNWWVLNRNEGSS